MTVVLK